MDLQTIHESFINGQRKQAVQQIEEYGCKVFFEDYPGYLYSAYAITIAFEYLKDAIISYHKIKNR